MSGRWRARSVWKAWPAALSVMVSLDGTACWIDVFRAG